MREVVEVGVVPSGVAVVVEEDMDRLATHGKEKDVVQEQVE